MARDRGTVEPVPTMPRYRSEDGASWIDLRARNIGEVSDGRDPTPIRARELDPDLVEYLRDSAEDLARERAFRVVFWIEAACNPVEVQEAFRARFAYVLERIARRRRERRRAGLVILVFASALFAALQVGARTAGGTLPGEGLTVLSWILLWRPIEVLVFDWVPARRELNVTSRLCKAPVAVRFGEAVGVAPVPHAASQATKPRD